MIWITGGVMMIANRTGRKNMIIGTVSFGGSDAAFLSASLMCMDRCSFAETRSAMVHGAAVIGLREASDDPFDAIKSGAPCEILVCSTRSAK
jgi:hypothetical protein